MKVFILYARENWITDILVNEWVENNKYLYTNNVIEADIIWILSNYVINKLPLNIYKQKKVITTIHHITPWKVTQSQEQHFKILNQITDVFYTNQNICKNTLEKYVSKPIKVVPLWHNELIWYDINNKIELRNKYNLDKDSYIVGSFQRDTEGAGISSGNYLPKKEKGPDIFVKAVVLLKNKYPKLKVLLTGLRRQYIMKELQKNNIEFYYFEMCDFTKLNEFYNCLDLYIVGSRVEGGPRAINECSLTKTPLLSTNVGIAELLCHPDSIFDMNNVDTILNCKTDTEFNYEKAQKYNIKNYMKDFTKQLLK
jgi:glycosyltransferase involved in cell wall biosynthesis